MNEKKLKKTLKTKQLYHPECLPKCTPPSVKCKLTTVGTKKFKNVRCIHYADCINFDAKRNIERGCDNCSHKNDKRGKFEIEVYEGRWSID